MRKCLWKIPNLAFRNRVIFLRQQSDIVANREQPFEHLRGLVLATLQNKVIDIPKRAGKKARFVEWHAFHVARRITANETLPKHALFDCGHGAKDPWILGWQETDERN